MITPKIIQFIIETSEEGGYTASAVSHSIYTQGETLDETVKNIKEAVSCHFEEDLVSPLSSNLPIMINFQVPSLA